jgi:hypothetical protein
MFGIFLPGPGNSVLMNEADNDISQVSTVPVGVGDYSIGTQAVIPSATPVTVTFNFVTATAVPGATARANDLGDDGMVYDVAYSYYNPALGGINCHSANWDGIACADVTASGIRWTEYMGQGVAVPPSWLGVLGYGTVISVLDPAPIARQYTVIDICCGCEAGNWDDRRWRLDFLDDKQRLEWASPLRFVINSRTAPENVGVGVCYGG